MAEKKAYEVKINEQVRKIDEDIMLGDHRCVRAYIIAAEKVDVDYTKGPDEHIPYPTKSVQYTRFVSREILEPVDDKDRREKARATKILNELRTRDTGKDAEAKAYLIDYIATIEDNGQLVSDKITRARERLGKLEEERRTWMGIGKYMADLLGFRGASGVAGYSLLEGPFGESEISLGGLHFRGKDIAWLGAASLFGIASVTSYVWKGRKNRAILTDLSEDLDSTYRRAISETLEDLRNHYPKAIVPLGTEDVLAKKDATEMLKRKYVHKEDR
jgi:hypothetical protein